MEIVVFSYVRDKKKEGKGSLIICLKSYNFNVIKVTVEVRFFVLILCFLDEGF